MGSGSSPVTGLLAFAMIVAAMGRRRERNGQS
jgi:uncharacterized protein (TIGR03382 family)